MTLRSRCEALVRELSGPSIEASDRLADYCAGQDDVIKRLQAALDAQRSSDLEDDRLRADEGRGAALPTVILHDSWEGTAARLEQWAKQKDYKETLAGQTMAEAALFIRHFLPMKESKP
jgi:hypothetical protein